jgi:hypothetical protein
VAANVGVEAETVDPARFADHPMRESPACANGEYVTKIRSGRSSRVVDRSGFDRILG